MFNLLQALLQITGNPQQTRNDSNRPYQASDDSGAAVQPASYNGGGYPNVPLQGGMSGALQGGGAMGGQIRVPQGRGGGLRVGNANGPVMSGSQLQGSSPQMQGGGDYRFGGGYLQGSPQNPQTTMYGPYLQAGSLPRNNGVFLEDTGLEGDYLQGNNPYRGRGL